MKSRFYQVPGIGCVWVWVEQKPRGYDLTLYFQDFWSQTSVSATFVYTKTFNLFDFMRQTVQLGRMNYEVSYAVHQESEC